MKRNITYIVAGLLLGTSIVAHAGPAEDRSALINEYKQILPDIKFENYIYGALAMNPDAMSQYNSFMEFPSYSIDLDKGKKIWETPFKNGKQFSSCFPNGGKNVAGDSGASEHEHGRVGWRVHECRGHANVLCVRRTVRPGRYPGAWERRADGRRGVSSGRGFLLRVLEGGHGGVGHSLATGLRT